MVTQRKYALINYQNAQARMQIRNKIMDCDRQGQITSKIFKMTLCVKDYPFLTIFNQTSSSKSKLHREPSNYCNCGAHCCVQWQANMQIQNKPWSSTTVLFWDAALIQCWDLMDLISVKPFSRPWINLVDTAEKVASVRS